MCTPETAEAILEQSIEIVDRDEQDEILNNPEGGYDKFLVIFRTNEDETDSKPVDIIHDNQLTKVRIFDALMAASMFISEENASKYLCILLATHSTGLTYSIYFGRLSSYYTIRRRLAEPAIINDRLRSGRVQPVVDSMANGGVLSVSYLAELRVSDTNFIVHRLETYTYLGLLSRIIHFARVLDVTTYGDVVVDVYQIAPTAWPNLEKVLYGPTRYLSTYQDVDDEESCSTTPRVDWAQSGF